MRGGRQFLCFQELLIQQLGKGTEGSFFVFQCRAVILMKFNKKVWLESYQIHNLESSLLDIRIVSIALWKSIHSRAQHLLKFLLNSTTQPFEEADQHLFIIKIKNNFFVEVILWILGKENLSALSSIHKSSSQKWILSPLIKFNL